MTTENFTDRKTVIIVGGMPNYAISLVEKLSPFEV